MRERDECDGETKKLAEKERKREREDEGEREKKELKKREEVEEGNREERVAEREEGRVKLLRVSCACSTLPSRPLPPPPRPAHLKTSYPAIKTPRKLYASRPRAPAPSKRTTWLSY